MRQTPADRKDKSRPDGRAAASPAAGATRARGALVLAALAAATLFKLYLARYTAGTLDVAAYADYADTVRNAGGVGLYHAPGAYSPYFYLPFGVHLLRLLGWLASATPLPFAFWLRLPSVAADVGSLLLVWRHFARANRDAAAGDAAPNDEATNAAAGRAAARPVGAPARWRLTTAQFAALLLLALSPVSIIVSGFHGNTDPLMTFFALLSVSLLDGAGRAETAAKRRRELAAGVAFAMAINLKIVPLIFAPALWLHLAGARPRLRFFGAAAATVFVSSLPYVLQEPLTIARSVFGYGSLYGAWGWSYLLAQALPETLHYSRPPHGLYGPHAAYAEAGKWLMFALIAAAAVWTHGRAAKADERATRPGESGGARPSPVLQCGLALSLFLALTPGFGMQYLAWLVPFVAALGLLPSLVFNVTVGYYVVACYVCWFNSPPPAPCATFDPAPLMLAAWFSIILLVFFHLHALRRDAPRAATEEARQ